MSFVAQNQRFVNKIYKEIENKMVKHFENGLFNFRIFEYRSASTKAFCMPEVKTDCDLKIIKKLYDLKFEIKPIDKDRY